MSFSLSKVVVLAARGVLVRHRGPTRGFMLSLGKRVTGLGQINLTVNRTLSYMSTTRERWSRPRLLTAYKPCGFCGIHTAGDKELVTFLTEEINLEKKSQKAGGTLPQLKGFQLTTDGCDVVFTKKSNSETVKIRFNVNNSVDDDFPPENPQEHEGHEHASEVVSRPPFTVEINKGGKKTLALNCDLPGHADGEVTQSGQQHQDEQYEDIIEIQEVALLDGDDWDDNIYTLSGHIMDGNLYNMLLSMLEERGITAELVDQLIEFSTAYEQQQYVSFLERLKDFAAAK